MRTIVRTAFGVFFCGGSLLIHPGGEIFSQTIHWSSRGVGGGGFGEDHGVLAGLAVGLVAQAANHEARHATLPANLGDRGALHLDRVGIGSLAYVGGCLLARHECIAGGDHADDDPRAAAALAGRHRVQSDPLAGPAGAGPGLGRRHRARPHPEAGLRR